MNKFTYIFILFAVTYLFIGCNTKQSTNTTDNEYIEQHASTIDIKFDEALPITKTFEVSTTFKFNEDTDHIIGSIQQMEVRGDTIFCIDPISHPGLYAYLKDGSQLFAYCNRGQASEDLMSPMNLSISDDKITVFDFAGKKLMTFSKQGKFLQSINLPMDAVAAIPDSKQHGIWIDYSNQDYNNVKLGYTNISNDSIRCVLNVPKYLKGLTEVPMANMVKLSNGDIRYMPSLEPRIFNLHEGKANLIYDLKFNGKWPSNEEIYEKFSGNDWATKYKDFPIKGKGFHESDKWLVMGFMFEKKLYIVVYDKLKLATQVFIDSDDNYYSPKYLDGSNLYLTRQDDSIDIINLDNTLNKNLTP